MHSDHEHGMDWLESYLDGELRSSRRQAVEAHLAGCVECQGRLEELQSLSRLLQSWPLEARSAPPRRLLAELRRPVAPPPAMFSPQQALGWAWRAVPVLLLLGLVFFQTVSVLEGVLSAIPEVEQSLLKGVSLFGSVPGVSASTGSPLVGLGVDMVESFIPFNWGVLTSVAVMAAIGLLYLSWLASWWVRQHEKLEGLQDL
jgi:anti-sigma factor RsiW